MQPSTEPTEAVALSDSAMNLQIGSVCCALRVKDKEVNTRLQQVYRNFICRQPADITIELERSNHIPTNDLEQVLSHTRYIHEDGNSFRTTSQVISGQYNLAERTVVISGVGSLIDPNFEYNHLNQLLSLAYYSACKIKYNGYPPAMLVHSCAILRHGKAFVFAGPSEAGKTTIARLCGENNGEVLNDETVLMSRPDSDGHVIVQGVPFVSRMSPRRNTAAPLSGIFLLKKGPVTRLNDVERPDAYLKFMRQVVAPAYIGQRDRRAVYSLMAEFSDEITGTIPVYELEFNLDGELLWRTVGGEFERC
jgi:hypothetical protein